MLNLLYKTIVQTNGQYFTKLQILHFTFILRMGKQGIFSLCGKKFVCHLKMAEHCDSAIQLVLNVCFGVCGGGRQPKHKNHNFSFGRCLHASSHLKIGHNHSLKWKAFSLFDHPHNGSEIRNNAKFLRSPILKKMSSLF